MRPFRIHLDPTAETGGGAAATPATPAATATPTPNASPTPTSTQPPGKVELSAEEYRRLLDNQARLNEIEAERQREIDAAKQREIDALAKRGEADTALAKAREQHAEELRKERERNSALEAERLADRKADAIKSGLLGVAFSNPAHGPRQVELLLANRLESVRDSAGQITVRDKVTGKPAADAIAEWLASEEANHFLAATNGGGSGSRGGSATTPTPKGADAESPKPKNLGQAFIMRARMARNLPPLPEHKEGKVRIFGGLVPGSN